MEAHDYDRAERLKYHLLVIQKGQTPGATPAVTPAYPAGATPRAENGIYSKASMGEDEEGDGKHWVVRDVNDKEVRIPSNISIGELAHMITSEDNDNFQKKQEMEVKKKREKYWWAYGDEDPEKPKALLMYSDEEIKLLKDQSERASWPKHRHTGFMDTPALEDTHDVCGVKLLTDIRPTQKLMINPKNTRLRGNKPEPSNPSSHSNSDSKSNSNINSNINSNSNSNSNSISLSASTSQGFSTNELIATPAPEPGVDALPQMTWGDIGGTPLTLGSAILPLDMPMTPLPAVNKRDAIAEKVYRDMKKGHAHRSAHRNTPLVGG